MVNLIGSDRLEHFHEIVTWLPSLTLVKNMTRPRWIARTRRHAAGAAAGRPCRANFYEML